jgi:hypothetical protein
LIDKYTKPPNEKEGSTDEEDLGDGNKALQLDSKKNKHTFGNY